MTNTTVAREAIHPTAGERRRRPIRYTNPSVPSSDTCASQWMASIDVPPSANRAAYTRNVPGGF